MQVSIVTASALARHCGYKRKLNKGPKHVKVQEAADEGTRFGRLVQDWLEGRNPQEPEYPDEPWCWFEALRATWRPPGGIRCEVPLGLTPEGLYEPVEEPLPHVYVPAPHRLGKVKLLTAGRADLLWTYEQRGLEGTDPLRAHVTKHVYVADLKRTAWRYGYPGLLPQLMALGLAAAAMERADVLHLGLYGARDGAWDWSDPIELAEHGESMLAEVTEMATLDEEPRPGDWCSSCYERRACEHALGET